MATFNDLAKYPKTQKNWLVIATVKKFDTLEERTLYMCSDRADYYDDEGNYYEPWIKKATSFNRSLSGTFAGKASVSYGSFEMIVMDDNAEYFEVDNQWWFRDVTVKCALRKNSDDDWLVGTSFTGRAGAPDGLSDQTVTIPIFDYMQEMLTTPLQAKNYTGAMHSVVADIVSQLPSNPAKKEPYWSEFQASIVGTASVFYEVTGCNASSCDNMASPASSTEITAADLLDALLAPCNIWYNFDREGNFVIKEFDISTADSTLELLDDFELLAIPTEDRVEQYYSCEYSYVKDENESACNGGRETTAKKEDTTILAWNPLAKTKVAVQTLLRTQASAEHVRDHFANIFFGINTITDIQIPLHGILVNLGDNITLQRPGKTAKQYQVVGIREDHSRNVVRLELFRQAGQATPVLVGSARETLFPFRVSSLTRDIPDGLVTESKLADSAVSTAKVSFAYASSASKGGNALDTDAVNGVSATAISTMYTDFNASNNQNGDAIVSPVVLTDGTAIDHTINTDGSANISFEWSWTADETLIDGFSVYVYSSTSGSEYNFGTTPSAEVVYTTTADKRAFILNGTPADQYYTFGVQAYRRVDSNVDASGVIKSTLVKATRTEENPYLPSANVAFAGDVTGTIGGTPYTSFTKTQMDAGVEITATNGALYAGKTSYPDTTAGFWLGRRSSDGAPTFHVGNATSYWRWDGTGHEQKGNSFVDGDITGATITGGVLQTRTASTASGTARFLVEDVSGRAKYFTPENEQVLDMGTVLEDTVEYTLLAKSDNSSGTPSVPIGAINTKGGPGIYGKGWEGVVGTTNQTSNGACMVSGVGLGSGAFATGFRANDTEGSGLYGFESSVGWDYGFYSDGNRKAAFRVSGETKANLLAKTGVSRGSMDFVIDTNEWVYHDGTSWRYIHDKSLVV